MSRPRRHLPGEYQPLSSTGKVILTAWCQAHEIDIALNTRELVDLRGFLNDVFTAALSGTEYPAAFIGTRK